MAFDFAPSGWAECNGQLLPVSQYQTLFNLMGTAFGGDGVNTFGIPDLRGRVPVCPGTGPGLEPIAYAEVGGVNATTLLPEHLPAHAHPLQGTSAAGTVGSPDGALPAHAQDASRNAVDLYSTATPDAPMQAGAIGSTGGGQAVTNMQPFLGLRWCIALTGYVFSNWP
jgi:microcystin-dependent protein